MNQNVRQHQMSDAVPNLLVVKLTKDTGQKAGDSTVYTQYSAIFVATNLGVRCADYPIDIICVQTCKDTCGQILNKLRTSFLHGIYIYSCVV